MLMSLGQTDFGLYGVVGGLTAFIAFFNGLISSAVGRFYAFSIGKASVSKDAAAGLEDCRRWFNTAVCIHTILPIVLMAVGYPIGEWAVRHWLAIPPDRIDACVWVFRFACVTCFIGMVNVPFTAMYTAKQYIAELTIYSFAQTTVNFFFLYFMVTHPGDWLAKYALYTCCLSAVPQLIICARAFVVFPECRIRLNYWFDIKRFKELASFGFWQAFGVVGHMLRSQGIAILANKSFGPSINAAMTVANNVNYHASTLATSLVAAFSPAITNAYGAGEMYRMRRMAFAVCKIGMLLVLVFALPLAAEVETVMRLWLKTPPEYSAELCLCMLGVLLLDKSTVGHMIAVNASGKVAFYQFAVGGFFILTLPVAWLFVVCGWGPCSIGWALLITMTLGAWSRVFFARTIVGMSIRRWIVRIMLPVASLIVVVGGVSFLPRMFMDATFLRVVVTTMLAEAAMAIIAWRFAFDNEERDWVRVQLGKRLLNSCRIKKDKAVIALPVKDECCGCGACVTACPFAALRMEADANGFMCPSMDVEVCRKCEKCVAVCPVIKNRMPVRPKAVFAAKTNDGELRMASASGGVFGELARVVLSRGGVVVGAMWDGTGRRVVHGIVEQWSEMGKLNGSKYVQSDLARIYEDVCHHLTSGRLVLFSGTPCQVSALLGIVGADNDNLITVALICYGVPSPLALECFIRSEERKAESVMTRVLFREKDVQTGGLVSRVEFVDKKKMHIFSYTNSPYSRAFFNNLTTRPSCTTCKFRKGSSGADLQIGDCWGLQEQGDVFDDGKGLSAVLINTTKGERIFRQTVMIKKEISYKFLFAHNPMLEENPKRNARQDVFFAKIRAGADFTKCVDGCLCKPLYWRFARKVVSLIRHKK